MLRAIRYVHRTEDDKKQKEKKRPLNADTYAVTSTVDRVTIWVLFNQAGRGRGVVPRGRIGGPQARGPVRGGRNPAASGVRGVQRLAARGGVRAKGSLPGEDGLYLHNKSSFTLFTIYSLYLSLHGHARTYAHVRVDARILTRIHACVSNTHIHTEKE